MNDGSTLISRAGGEVAERAYKVGETTRGCALGCHISYEVGILLLNFRLDCRLELLAGEVGKCVVCKVLELQLVGSALKTAGVSGGNNRVSGSHCENLYETSS